MRLSGLKGAKKRKKPLVQRGRRKPTAIVCVNRITPQLFEVGSDSRPIKHRVKYARKSDHMEWQCSCEAWIYRKLGEKECKHIKQVKDRVCTWKSTIGPEEQVLDGRCPRCNGITEFEYSTDEEGD